MPMNLPETSWLEYRARLKTEYAAGWLPAKHYLVLVAIADLNAAGDWEPTAAKIALNAGCDSRTVRRARRRAEGRGLLAVQAQFTMIDGRPQQRANRYELVLPTTPCQPKLRTFRGGQTGRPSEVVSLRKRLTRDVVVDNSGRNLLSERAAAFHAQQRAQIQAKYLHHAR
jgi:hypothetical protein